MTELAHPNLFTPVKIGPISLKHRVVMAPLTRSRSEQPGDIPGALMLEHGSCGSVHLPHIRRKARPEAIRAPSATDTEISNFAKTEAGHSFILGMQALQRIAKPADIASVVPFLASDDARWITGTTIHVDGGSKL